MEKKRVLDNSLVGGVGGKTKSFHSYEVEVRGKTEKMGDQRH